MTPFFVLREEKSLAKVYEKNSYSVSFQFVKRKTARSEEFNNLEQLPRQARNDGRNRRSALLIRVQNGQDVAGRQRAQGRSPLIWRSGRRAERFFLLPSAASYKDDPSRKASYS